jgi:hypothetical protein
MIPRLALTILLLCLSASAQQEKVTWKVINEGNGQPVAMGDTVAITYVLRLADGTLVDASPESTSYRFALGSPKVLPGLSLGVEGMRRGETREIVIPPELGYGSRAVGPIPPDSKLFFRVDLNYIVKSVDEDAPLAEVFGKDGFENRPDARNLDKPAMFEYLIRDFFTRPWRYDDSPTLTWKASGLLTICSLALWLVASGLRRRQGWPE